MKRKNLEASHTRAAISLDRLDRQRQVRYFRVFVDGEDVSRMVGDFIGKRVSSARGTCDCVIVRGCGMNMGFWIQDALHSAAYAEGFPDMFDADEYDYLGRNKCP